MATRLNGFSVYSEEPLGNEIGSYALSGKAVAGTESFGKAKKPAPILFVFIKLR